MIPGPGSGQPRLPPLPGVRVAMQMHDGNHRGKIVGVERKEDAEGKSRNEGPTNGERDRRELQRTLFDTLERPLDSPDELLSELLAFALIPGGGFQEIELSFRCDPKPDGHQESARSRSRTR